MTDGNVDPLLVNRLSVVRAARLVAFRSLWLLTRILVIPDATTTGRSTLNGNGW